MILETLLIVCLVLQGTDGMPYRISMSEQSKCPDHLTGHNVAYSERMGCVWADDDDEKYFYDFNTASARCKSEYVI